MKALSDPLHRIQDLPQRPKPPVIPDASKGLFSRDFEDLEFLIPWVAPVPTRFQAFPHLLKAGKTDLETRKRWETEGDETEAARTEDDSDRNEPRKGRNLLKNRFAHSKEVQTTKKEEKKAKVTKTMRKVAEIDIGKRKNRLVAGKKPSEKVGISMTKSMRSSLQGSQTVFGLSRTRPEKLFSQTMSAVVIHKNMKQLKVMRQTSPRLREKPDQASLTQSLKDLRRPPIQLRATALKAGFTRVNQSVEELDTFISFNASHEEASGLKARLKEDVDESPRTFAPRRTEAWSAHPSSETHNKAIFCYV